MLGGNQDDGMMQIHMVFMEATEPSPHPRALRVLSLMWGCWGPTGAACRLPRQLSPEASPGRSLFGHVGRDRSDFPLMVSISLVQFQDGFPFISLLFPVSHGLRVSERQKAMIQGKGLHCV